MTRDLIVAALVTATAGALVAAEPAAPRTVAGKVFLDANRNGTPDDGEKGIPGVRVTDGVGFATTDGDGAYRIDIGADPLIPYRPAQTVGVCWPTGTWPTGRWWIRLSKIEDANAVHFALRKDVQTLPFLYLHMTDPHEHFTKAHLDFAKFVNALPPDVKFILDTGDTYRPKSAEKPFRIPFFSTVGNHDTWESPEPPPDPDDAGYGGWTNRLGPVRWSFDHAGVHFVGVDVVDGLNDKRAKVMLDWLEKDLKALPPATRIVLSYHVPDPSGSKRFGKLLRDYKVELIHAGHSHAYAYFDNWHAPMVTAYHWGPPGTCNVLVVSKDRIHIAVYCIGCKRVFGKHSRRCPVQWADHILLGSIRQRFTKRHTVDKGPLAGARTVELADPHAYILAEIDPAKAKRVGLRLGPGAEPLEIAFDGNCLIVDGAAAPFSFRPGQKTLDLTVFAHKNMLTVWANNYFFFEKPVTLTRVGAVTVFAEGGAANVESLTVQEVKADPDNKDDRFRCGCAHGALRRVP